jgi:hypothetical protein
MRLIDIGEELKLSKRSAHLALQYGIAMHNAGVTDPYIELADAPASWSHSPNSQLERVSSMR